MSMDEEIPKHVKRGAEEVERQIKEYLSQDSKKYTSTFKMNNLELTPQAYTRAISYLDDQGVIEKTGRSSQLTTWRYNGPEGEDIL